MTNQIVVRMFLSKHKDYCQSNFMHTYDGKLYSYRMLIAEWRNGELWIANKSNSPSQTTTKHINLVNKLFSGN